MAAGQRRRRRSQEVARSIKGGQRRVEEIELKQIVGLAAAGHDIADGVGLTGGDVEDVPASTEHVDVEPDANGSWSFGSDESNTSSSPFAALAAKL